jgi:hypothetical protein
MCRFSSVTVYQHSPGDEGILLDQVWSAHMTLRRLCKVPGAAQPSAQIGC